MLPVKAAKSEIQNTKIQILLQRARATITCSPLAICTTSWQWPESLLLAFQRECSNMAKLLK